LELIKKEYAELYGKGLATAVKAETSGDFEKALLSIIEGNQ
jgi:hypothetical protein